MKPPNQTRTSTTQNSSIQHLRPRTENSRDHLTTVTETGKRIWLYPKATTGRFTRYRAALAWVLLGLLFGLPWLEVQGHPVFLFNLLERRFIFFGVEFFPQDFHLVAIGLLSFMVFIMGFTVLYGRVWCGWACPQTVFMEFVFRKIEVFIEGDHHARRRLDAAPWSGETILKKTAKHGLFFLVSFAIANTFLAYFIGKEALLGIMTDNPFRHFGALSAMLIFTAVFYAVFAYLREIVCTVICPYGRLQGVLFDKKTIQVAYDSLRGEPRGRRLRNTDHGMRIENTFPKNTLYPHGPQSAIALPKSGDCVDCTLCVQVCPTGIDIRNGSQMECIGCTACMDACDEVMVKIQRPTGLIRYASTEGIEQGKPLRVTSRTLAYSAVLLGLLGVLAYLLLTRAPLETTLLRAPGLTYQQAPGGMVSNLYTVEFVNKTTQPRLVRLRLVNQPGARLEWVGASLTLAPGEVTKGTFFVKIPYNALTERVLTLKLDVLGADGQPIDQVSTKFLGPVR